MNADLDRVAGVPIVPGTLLQLDLPGESAEDPHVLVVGEVASTDDDFLVMVDSRGNEQEYVLHSGFYGAHGDLDGILDLAEAGKAKVTVLMRFSPHVFSVLVPTTRHGMWKDTGDDVWVPVSTYGDVARPWVNEIAPGLVAAHRPDEKPGRLSIRRHGSGIREFLVTTSRGRPLLLLEPDADSPLWRTGSSVH